jgi:hypothetical protein
MKIKMTKYLKDAGMFRPTEAPFEAEVTPEDFNLIVSLMGFKETTTPGHYWKRTAWDEGETLDIVTE